ncbi:hypothetical protein E0H22_12115 [Rhodopseudomonas boonkerdii]|uniref:hypothetical protein n=1 Tax=Rhodopseudomonas boonkerdii TaxID=475937 RepID=UPI001E4C3556|nr:hypothetical protein [Rhodopseudomonas boonkerdii]UGV26368.1 hypothetical protein E0H22_12115 [Rhodopseudomonas boonkerdii]
MDQRQPFSATDDNTWLSDLIAGFARTEELRGQSCSPAIISAAKARLERPANVRRSQTAHRAELLELSF